MGQQPVVKVDDITKIDFASRRPGCEKGIMHEDGAVQTAVFRVAPGSGVPRHLHSRVYAPTLVQSMCMPGAASFAIAEWACCCSAAGIPNRIIATLAAM